MVVFFVLQQEREVSRTAEVQGSHRASCPPAALCVWVLGTLLLWGCHCRCPTHRMVTPVLSRSCTHHPCLSTAVEHPRPRSLCLWGRAPGAGYDRSMAGLPQHRHTRYPPRVSLQKRCLRTRQVLLSLTLHICGLSSQPARLQSSPSSSARDPSGISQAGAC